jgi:hypothetical protein
MRSQALGGAHLSLPSWHESRAHQLVPASDHSARTVALVRIDLRIIRPARRSTRERSPYASSPSGQSRRSASIDTYWNSQRQRHHARVPPQESPPFRAAGARRVVVTTSRYVPHSAAPQRGDQPCARSLIARPHGVRLGVTMRVHRVRIVRAYRPLRSQDGAASLELIQQHSHRCWSTRGYHAWTKGITVLAAGSKASANERCRPSRPSSAACRWTRRRGDARARPPAGTSGRA